MSVALALALACRTAPRIHAHYSQQTGMDPQYRSAAERMLALFSSAAERALATLPLGGAEAGREAPPTEDSMIQSARSCGAANASQQLSHDGITESPSSLLPP